MSRYTDANLDDIISMTGWNDTSLLSLYANFIAQRHLDDEFEEFCRGQAEEELSDDERLEDEEAAWEEAGGPLCPQCGVVHTGVWNQSHKMDCSVGRTPLSRLNELVEQYEDEAPYGAALRRYVDAVTKEDE